jgi:hypothetical protein
MPQNLGRFLRKFPGQQPVETLLAQKNGGLPTGCPRKATTVGGENQGDVAGNAPPFPEAIG